MKILLFGKNGQLGWELQRSLAPLGELLAFGSDQADFSAPAGVAALVRRERPQLIVNAAAYTAVDKAETDAEAAHLVNALTPGAVADEAAALGACLVHYSTDYVFDGSGEQPWREDDHTGPLNAYGRTKLDGEHLVRRSGCRHLILRTSWVYAARGGNFAKTMLRLAAERERLQVVADQHGAPTGAELLADVTAHAVRAVQREPELAGTYHVAAAGETTWHDYARFVIDWARAHGRAVKVHDDAIEPVASSAFPTPARRPSNSRLATDRLQQRFGLVMPPWQHGVERMLTELTG